MRFRDLLKNINKYEQKLENALLYVDFLPDHTLPLILMKDGSLLVLFELGGLDYEGLSEEDKGNTAITRVRHWSSSLVKTQASCSRISWSATHPSPFRSKAILTHIRSSGSCKTTSNASGMASWLEVSAGGFSADLG
jgi:hypothetical protein